MDKTCLYPSPLGDILLAADEEGLRGLWFVGQKYCGATLSPTAEPGENPFLQETKAWLDCYFSGREPDFCPRLCPRGTAFQQEVWALLREIPYGQRSSYGRLAQQLAEKRGRSSPRAVGSAVGHNPISILIPCHRVLAADGSLRGYAGGLWRKERLLALESGEEN